MSGFQIISKGTGLRPRNGQEVVIRVEDKLFGSDSYEKITFILGYSMVIEGNVLNLLVPFCGSFYILGGYTYVCGFSAWDLVVSSLSEGDVAQVKSSSRLAYGSTGDSKRNILPDQDMEYEIELIKVGKPVVFSDMPEPVLSEHARQLKERGNYYYLRKEFEKAIFVYKRYAVISFFHIMFITIFNILADRYISSIEADFSAKNNFFIFIYKISRLIRLFSQIILLGFSLCVVTQQ